MKKITTTILILFVCFGCKEQMDENKSTVERIVVHDTVRIVSAINTDSIMATVDNLLMQYYSAGWMDGTNAAIDLYNEDNFTNASIDKKRQQYWNKMRFQIASK